jgi:hypothetical protein
MGTWVKFIKLINYPLFAHLVGPSPRPRVIDTCAYIHLDWSGYRLGILSEVNSTVCRPHTEDSPLLTNLQQVTHNRVSTSGEILRNDKLGTFESTLDRINFGSQVVSYEFNNDTTKDPSFFGLPVVGCDLPIPLGGISTPSLSLQRAFT